MKINLDDFKSEIRECVRMCKQDQIDDLFRALIREIYEREIVQDDVWGNACSKVCRTWKWMGRLPPPAVFIEKYDEAKQEKYKDTLKDQKEEVIDVKLCSYSAEEKKACCAEINRVVTRNTLWKRQKRWDLFKSHPARKFDPRNPQPLSAIEQGSFPRVGYGAVLEGAILDVVKKLQPEVVPGCGPDLINDGEEQEECPW